MAAVLKNIHNGFPQTPEEIPFSFNHRFFLRILLHYHYDAFVEFGKPELFSDFFLNTPFGFKKRKVASRRNSPFFNRTILLGRSVSVACRFKVFVVYSPERVQSK